MSQTKHQGHIEDDFVLDGYSTAVCNCGWSVDPHIDPQLAIDDLTEHYREVKEIS